MKKLMLLLLVISTCGFVVPQKDETRVVYITLDGYRWQELFGGADTSLISDGKYVADENELNKLFYRKTAEERRAALMPFFWNDVKNMGMLIGNRWIGSNMEVANNMHFSYPGYNEDLCGCPDDENIHSNDKIYNPNRSILEVANETDEYRGRVLAFASWDVFPYILNEKRSHLEVNAGYRHSLASRPTAKEMFLNDIQDENPRHWESVRFDVYTYHYALEAMKTRKPKFIYIGFGETDDFAHEGRYDQYLKSAHRTDEFIRRLWEYTQSDPFYKGKTTFIITCDHGRGDSKTNKDDWKSHGMDVNHSGQTWLVAFGKGIPAKGEYVNKQTYYNKQIAPTIASFLGIKFDTMSKNGGTRIIF